MAQGLDAVRRTSYWLPRSVRTPLAPNPAPHGRAWLVVNLAAVVVAGLAGAAPMGPATQPRAPSSEATTQSALPDWCRNVTPARQILPAAALTAPAAGELARAYRAATQQPGQWVDVASLSWEAATSGWQYAADFGEPKRGASFPGSPFAVAGVRESRGIGTYPFSEITYALEGNYAAFRAAVGVDDSAPTEGSVRFLIYGDDRLLSRSPIMLRGESARMLEVPLVGVRTLRLVAHDAGDGPHGDYANWLHPELLHTATQMAPPGATLPALPAAFSQARATGPGPSKANAGEAATTAVWYDKSECALHLVNGPLHLALGYGGVWHGRFWLFSTTAGRMLVGSASPALALYPDGWLPLDLASPRDLNPWSTTEVKEPGLGAGRRLVVGFGTADGGEIDLEFTLFDRPPSLTYRIVHRGLAISSYRYLGGESTVLAGAQPRFLADRSRLWRGRVADDGLARSVPLEPGKPLLLWSDVEKTGLLFATLEGNEIPIDVELRRAPGKQEVSVGLTLTEPAADRTLLSEKGSPRLLIQPVDASHVLRAFQGYRSAIDELYPKRPLPSSMRYQWDSWWTFGPTVTDQGMRREIDYIVANLSDLGPWNVVIDAAWHVAYGAPTADLRNVDWEKFPDGVRSVADYAHRNGITVGLFMSAGFLHTGRGDGGEWLALRAIIDEHPGWLIPLLDDGGIQRYMLNYDHPEVRRYITDVVDDFVLVHGVDGIKLDGLADPEGQFSSLQARDRTATRTPYLPSADVLKLIADRLFMLRPDGYLESGWLNPVFAHPYAHTFWGGDNWPSFDRAYPFSGLAQKIEYTLFQRVALGQRGKMATVWGDPNNPDTRRWFAAAISLGAQITAGFDLTAMDARSLSAFRALLAHYRPFEGETIASGEARPNVFATVRPGVAYVGILNRSSKARSFTGEVASLGLPLNGPARNAESGAWIPASRMGVEVPPRTFQLFIVPRKPQIVWSDASWTYGAAGAGAMVATLHGPSAMTGLTELWSPGAKTVLLDGAPLRRGSMLAAGLYTLDDATGVLKLQVPLSQPRRLEVYYGS